MRPYYILSLLVLLISFNSTLSQTLAFPGAEGYGKYTTGGRGGRVIEVTNLLDRDRRGGVIEGSLRAALNTPGTDPLTIVFKVSGVIELSGELKSGRSNLTIAGQTAPGGGVCIKDGSVFLSGDNLIIRYIRFRPGDELHAETTALNIENAQNIIIDHCSMSWSVEENMGFYDNKYTTVQWCILSEGLYDSFDDKGARSYGAQWGGQYASYHHNLLAHNRSRAPRINGSYSNDTMAVIDFRNNVIFNWGGSGAIYGAEEAIEGGKAETNFVNNYYKPGPVSSKAFARPSYARVNIPATGFASWYFSGNYMEGVTGGMNDDNWLGVEIISEIGSAENIRSNSEFDVEKIPTQTAQEAYESVVLKVGAILPVRDDVDIRIIKELKGEVALQNATGIIDSQADVGGWPTYDSLLSLSDLDIDGMPDSYEIENSLDPNDATDGAIITASGYSNLEIYLNSIDGITGLTPAVSIEITVENGSETVVVGGSLQFSASILPIEAQQIVSWKSDDNSIATISEDGLLMGVSVGTANITATATDGSEVAISKPITVIEVLNVASQSELSVFPNPSQSIFRFNTDRTLTQAQVLNLSGRVLMQKPLEKPSDYLVDLSVLPKGTYILNLIGAQETWKTKIVK